MGAKQNLINIWILNYRQESVEVIHDWRTRQKQLMQLKQCCWGSAWFLSFFPTRCWHFTRRSNIAAPLRPLLPQMQWSHCNQWRQKARRGRFQRRCIFNVASRSSWVKILLTSSQPNSFSAIRRIAVENRAIVTAAEFIGDRTGSCYLLVQQTTVASVQAELDSIYPLNLKTNKWLFCFSVKYCRASQLHPSYPTARKRNIPLICFE